MLSFNFTPSFDGPLVPAPDEWPVFDQVYFYSSDDQTPSPPHRSDALPRAFPSPASLASMPVPPSRTSPRNKNPNYIPRPRNAFMLFRSAFAAAQKISAKIEHDNRHITRIIAHCWNSLSEAEKQVWRDMAKAEKIQHAARYPNYRFSPVGRANKPVKRNVRRNGASDVKRCEKLAELVMEGKCGQELESAIRRIDVELRFAERSISTDSDVSASPKACWMDPKDAKPADVAPFRSPLLPPATSTASQQVPDVSLPHPSVRVVTPPPVEPQTFYIMEREFGSLFAPPRFQDYQLNEGNDDAPPLVSVSLPTHAEPDQSVSDYFPWNQSDSFSYYN